MDTNYNKSWNKRCKRKRKKEKQQSGDKKVDVMCPTTSCAKIGTPPEDLSVRRQLLQQQKGRTASNKNVIKTTSNIMIILFNYSLPYNSIIATDEMSYHFRNNSPQDCYACDKVARRDCKSPT